MGVRRRPCRSFTMLTSRSIRHCGQRAAVALGANRPAPATHRAVLRPADQRQKLAGRIEELPRLIFFWPRAAGWRRRPEARLVARKKIATRLNLRLRSGSRCALIETLRTCLLQWATRPLSKSTCPAKSPLEGGNTYGTRRTRSNHPGRGANPGADAQPGRRGRARAGARRLCGAGRGPSRARGRAATSRGRAARVTELRENLRTHRARLRDRRAEPASVRLFDFRCAPLGDNLNRLSCCTLGQSPAVARGADQDVRRFALGLVRA